MAAPPAPAAPPVASAPAAPPTASGEGRGIGAARSAARLITPAVLKIPSDITEAMTWSPIAHFHIDARGIVTDVELTNPTPNPQLNRSILEQLRAYRFFPALDEGKPTPSTIDVRVGLKIS